MIADRSFCRFYRGDAVSPVQSDGITLTIREIPEGGFCLSSFLVIKELEDPEKVLMGHLNPNAAWDYIGALDSERIKTHSTGWMLPSCHLIYGESPLQAAQRIADEQLVLEKESLSFEDGPTIFSDFYVSRHTPAGAKHWDLGFIFKSTLGKDAIRPNPAWSVLEFVALQKAKERGEIARSHADILEYAGL